MFGFDLITAAGLLVLAGNAASCSVPKAPAINVVPVSAPIEYNFSLSSAELAAFKGDTVSPYAPGVDATTGGVRRDQPEIRADIKLRVKQDPASQTICLWYDSINVTIDLAPKIYIAKEERYNDICREAIIEHEVRHVEVDREVINRYAKDLGVAVKQAVDSAGVQGPYKLENYETVRDRMVDHIEAAMDARKLQLYKDMAVKQAEVDSLEEYQRISRICEEAKK